MKLLDRVVNWILTPNDTRNDGWCKARAMPRQSRLNLGQGRVRPWWGKMKKDKSRVGLRRARAIVEQRRPSRVGKVGMG